MLLNAVGCLSVLKRVLYEYVQYVENRVSSEWGQKKLNR